MTINVTALQNQLEAQKRTINALQNENHWLQDVIFNPSFNEIDMRLLVKNTPREMRMGLCTEFPAKKIYLPDQAEAAHCSPKVASQHLRIIAKKTGAFSYRPERDEETGNTRVVLQPLPPAETPAQLAYDRAKRGGSTWEDGKRVKRCKDCGSANLARISQIICVDCGSAQTEKTYKPVNDTDSQYDTDLDEQEDRSYRATDPDCHIDTDPLPAEISNLPPSTVNTQEVRERTTASEELQALPQWVVWKYGDKPRKDGKRDKVPYNVHDVLCKAKVDDSTTWASYDDAVAKYEESQKWFTPLAGIGFVFNHNGIVGIDQDGCLDPRIHSYAETSVSGTGIHIFAHGSIPKGTRRNGIEMYDAGRFFTWTGNHLAGTPETIEDCQAELDALYKELAPEVPKTETKFQNFTCSRSDEEILDKARNARNGAKFTALYGGDWSGYHSQSEADQALCKMLAYWCDGNVSTIDRLFQQSRLKRDKWNEKRGSQTYGEITISKAIGQHWQVVS